MSRRLSGLLLILRALSPIFIVLIVGSVFMVVLADLANVIDEPVQRIQEEIVDVGATLADVKDDVTAVVDDVSAVVQVFNDFDLSLSLPDIPTQLQMNGINLPSVTLRLPDPTKVTISRSSLPSPFNSIRYPSGITIGSSNIAVDIPDIPAFNIPIPGATQLNTAFDSAYSEILSVFDTLTSVFDSFDALIVSLQTLPDRFGNIITELNTLSSNVGQLFIKWSTTLSIAIVIVLVLVVIYYIVPILDDFTRGWRMIRGLPAN